MPTVLDFEKPITALDINIQKLKDLSARQGVDNRLKISQLEAQREELLTEIYANLTTWDHVLLARHPDRPKTMDYIQAMFDDFIELHGDRVYGDDPAMVAGLGTIKGMNVAVMGQQKGSDLKERQRRNFAMARPEGYRKAMRVMKLAEKMNIPIITIIDTPAADPGPESESRGIGEAIARNLMEMSLLQVPVISLVIGEGGSGGALGIGVGDYLLMLQYAVYSVIPPEGCAAILWRDPTKAAQAATALRVTANDAVELGVADSIVPEPLGGAHRAPAAAADKAGELLWEELESLRQLPVPDLLRMRHERLAKMARFMG
ncbi:MAG: acetyl-CoA carboxylase carboxyltransferase subunit alpha [Armatimonadota bacterium]